MPCICALCRFSLHKSYIVVGKARQPSVEPNSYTHAVRRDEIKSPVPAPFRARTSIWCQMCRLKISSGLVRTRPTDYMCPRKVFAIASPPSIIISTPIAANSIPINRVTIFMPVTPIRLPSRFARKSVKNINTLMATITKLEANKVLYWLWLL